MFKSKNFLVGILVGLLVMLGLQWASYAYHINKGKQIADKADEFIVEYKNAKDKVAFLKNYNAESDSSISLSTSEASSGDCEAIITDYKSAHDMMFWLDQDSPDYEFILSYVRQLHQDWSDSGCLEQHGSLYNFDDWETELKRNIGRILFI